MRQGLEVAHSKHLLLVPGASVQHVVAPGPRWKLPEMPCQHCSSVTAGPPSLVPSSAVQPPPPPALSSLGSARVAPVQTLPRAASGLPLPPHLAALGRTASQPLTPMSLPPHLQGQSSLNSGLLACKGGTGSQAL